MESSSSFFLENTRGAASTASGRAKHPRGGRCPPLGLCPDQGTTSPLDPTLPPALFGRPGEGPARSAPPPIRKTTTRRRKETQEAKALFGTIQYKAMT